MYIVYKISNFFVDINVFFLWYDIYDNCFGYKILVDENLYIYM